MAESAGYVLSWSARASRVSAGELQQAPGSVGDGKVDEFTVRQPDRVAVRGGERVEHGLCPGELLGGWGEHVVDSAELTRPSAASRSSSSRPAGCERLSVTARLLRTITFHHRWDPSLP